MKEDHAGFILDLKRPTRDGYVACLAITPKTRSDGSADVTARLERNLGRAKAIELALELLTACDAPAEVLAKIRELNPHRIR